MKLHSLVGITFGITMLSGAAIAASPPPPAAAGNPVGCASPVGPGDSAATLLRRFAGNARKQTVPGAEGETAQALVLYPRDPLRRIEVLFSDDKMLHSSSITLRAARSVWTVAGLHIGDQIEQVTQRNARGFALTGFEWDYAGSVIDLKGGALSRLPGGCTVTIRFSPPATATSTPEALMGDTRLESTNPALRRLRPVVTELSLNWR